MELFSKNINLTDIKNYIDKIIIKFIENEKNVKLKEIMKYSLTDGKRIRPIIAFLTFKNLNQNLNFNEQKFSRLILIPELLHNISLIIDDLPCMDNDLYRRGKESTHNKFGILPSYITISRIIYNLGHFFRNEIDIDRKFNLKKKNGNIEELWVRDFLFEKYVSNINNLIEGQFDDLKFTNDCYDIEIIYKINKNKTAPLFVISFIIGYFCGILFNEEIIVYENTLEQLEDLGNIFGFIFQLNDDILDMEEDKIQNKNLNLSIHLGLNKSLKEFEHNCDLFKKKMEKLKLWDNNFKEIIDLLKKRINKYY